MSTKFDAPAWLLFWVRPGADCDVHVGRQVRQLGMSVTLYTMVSWLLWHKLFVALEMFTCRLWMQ